MYNRNNMAMANYKTYIAVNKMVFFKFLETRACI